MDRLTTVTSWLHVQHRTRHERQLAELMAQLQQLPALTTAATDAVSKKKLADHCETLMQTDKLDIIKHNDILLMACNQSLCDALWQAAVQNRSHCKGPVEMYRCVTFLSTVIMTAAMHELSDVDPLFLCLLLNCLLPHSLLTCCF